LPCCQTDKASILLARSAEVLHFAAPTHPCSKHSPCPIFTAAELITAFKAAATRLNTFLTQQQQQQQLQPQLHQQLVRLCCALLRMWSAIASPCRKGCPDAWLLKLLPALPIAAELALHVLNENGGHGLACGLTTTDQVKAISDGAVALKLVEASVLLWNNMVLREAQRTGDAIRPATQAEAPILSDTVQRALILHCCAFVRAWREGDQQQQQAAASASTAARPSSSSSWAPAEATNLLQQLGFPLAAVHPYTAAVCDTFKAVNGGVQHLHLAHSAVQASITARQVAVRQQDWQVRYRGILPAVATAAAGAAGSAGPQADSNSVVFAAGVLPEQLIYLTLEYLSVLGFGPDVTDPAMSAVSLVHTLLVPAITLRQRPQFALERSVHESYARGCVKYIWSGLGRQLLTASGVTDADEEGDEAAASSQRDTVVNGTTIVQEGGTVELPADAQVRLRMVWGHYSQCLFYAIHYYEGVLGGGVLWGRGQWI
jgi:hypothetical protein